VLDKSSVGSLCFIARFSLELFVFAQVTPKIIVGGIPLVHDCGAHFAPLVTFSFFHFCPSIGQTELS
jgi:hypothetical protein